jgi:hypothetical protein
LPRNPKTDEDARIQNKIVLGHWFLFSQIGRFPDRES